jgi:hypothetical protein
VAFALDHLEYVAGGGGPEGARVGAVIPWHFPAPHGTTGPNQSFSNQSFEQQILKVTTAIEHREALAESGYAGAFSVEIEGQLGVKPQLEQVNEAMRQSREFLAAHGLG